MFCNAIFLLARSESGLSGVTGTAGVLGVQTCTSDRRVGPAQRNKKEPKWFCPLRARCGAWPLKKLRLDYEAGVSPQTAKPQDDPVPIECACQGQSKLSFAQQDSLPTKGTRWRSERLGRRSLPRNVRQLRFSLGFTSIERAARQRAALVLLLHVWCPAAVNRSYCLS